MFGHIERIGIAARHHQERLVDEVHPLAGIKRHQVHQTAFGIAEGGAGMRVCLEVILIAVTIEVKRELLRLLRRNAAHITHIFRCFAIGFFLTGGTGIGKTLLHIAHLRIKKSVAPHQSRVEHTERGHCLEAFVRLRGFQRITASATDAEYADAVGIHSGILRQDVGGTVYVLNAVGRLVHVARLSLASALIGCIKGKADVALLCHPLAVQTCHLLLTASVGMRHDKSGIGFRRVITGRGINIGNHRQTVQFVGDAMNVHLARLVLGNGSLIGQPERIGVVTLYRVEINYGKRFCHLLLDRVHCVGRATKKQGKTQRGS